MGRKGFSFKAQLCGVFILLADIVLCFFLLLTRRFSPNDAISLLGWAVDCGEFHSIPGVTKHDDYCKSSNSASNAAILSQLVTKSMTDHNVQSKGVTTDPVPLYNVKPHGLLKGVDMTDGNYADTNLMQTIETWFESIQGHSSLDFGVRLRHGRLVVPTSGLYQIFSHIDFTEMNEVSGQDAPKLQHKMYKFNILHEEKGEVEVLQAGLTPCLTNTKWKQEKNAGSYVGAITYLQAGDEIAVRVTHVHLLRANNGQHYFGLHRLSQ